MHELGRGLQLERVAEPTEGLEEMRRLGHPERGKSFHSHSLVRLAGMLQSRQKRTIVLTGVLPIKMV